MRKKNHHIFKRGNILWFRHKPRGKKGIACSLQTSDERVARKRRDEILSTLEVHVAEYTLAKVLCANAIEKNEKLNSYINREFPGVHKSIGIGKTVSEVMEIYLDSKVAKKRPLSATTLNNYKRDISRLVSDIGDIRMTELTTEVIRAYFITMAEYDEPDGDGPKLSDRTISNRFENIKSFFTWSEKYDYIPVNIMRKIETPEYDMKNTMSPPFELVESLSCIPLTQRTAMSLETWNDLQLMYRYTGCRLDDRAICVE
jgi:hypothetical protein